MHTLLDLHGNIPTFIRVTCGDVHDRRCARRKHPGRDRDRDENSWAWRPVFIKRYRFRASRFGKTPILCAFQTSKADAEFAESVSQLILFDI